MYRLLLYGGPFNWSPTGTGGMLEGCDPQRVGRTRSWVCVLLMLLMFSNTTLLSRDGTDYTSRSEEHHKYWTIRFLGGFATSRALLRILVGDLQIEERRTAIIGLDVGRCLVTNLGGRPLDLIVKLGVIRHQEKGFQRDFHSYNVYLKGYYHTRFRGRRVRFFLAEGLSYAELVPYVEGRDVRRMSNERDSRTQNYLNVGVDLNLGDLFQTPVLHPVVIGFSVSHRSGVFGFLSLFNNTSGGGNYNTLYLEYIL